MPFAAMIKCPKTGELINTGVAVGDKRQFENATRAHLIN